MSFPTIDYGYWLDIWNIQIGNKPIYSNINNRRYINFFGTINSCAEEIGRLISAENLNREIILRVIDLIYLWGGRSGRMFYSENRGVIPRDLLETDQVFQIYLNGIHEAKMGKPLSREIFSNIKGIGTSYSSKHAYFWSLNSGSRLIIVDSKIAGALGFASIQELYQNISYEESC